MIIRPLLQQWCVRKLSCGDKLNHTKVLTPDAPRQVALLEDRPRPPHARRPFREIDQRCTPVRVELDPASWSFTYITVNFILIGSVIAWAIVFCKLCDSTKTLDR